MSISDLHDLCIQSFLRLNARLDEMDASFLRLEADLIDVTAQLDALLPRSRRRESPMGHARLQACIAKYVAEEAGPYSVARLKEGRAFIQDGRAYVTLGAVVRWLKVFYPDVMCGTGGLRAHLLSGGWVSERFNASGGVRKRVWKSPPAG